MTNPPDDVVSVRYLVDDVPAAIDFYTTHLGFTVQAGLPPAFADVARGHLRLLLSGPTSSAGRIRCPTAASPARRVEPHPPERARHRRRGRPAARGRPDLPQRHRDRARRVSRSCCDDPSGNPVELFQPADQAP